MENIIGIFDKMVSTFQGKIATIDCNDSVSYKEMQIYYKAVASALIKTGLKGKPILIYMERSRLVPSAMFGIMASGNFYVVLDVDSPMERINKIVATLSPKAVVCDNDLKDKAKLFMGENSIFAFEDLIKTKIDSIGLEKVQKEGTLSDAAFAIFTSGSTGTPKGTLISHLNVLTYVNWFATRFEITPLTVFGSQTPFYFSMSVSDMFGALLNGASYVIIPKSYFTFPAKLISFINEHKVNTLYWVPTALAVVAKFNLFKYSKPEFLKKVLFAGEVMPVKYLNYWRKFLPEVTYANLFGPTETTDICTYYVVDRDFSESENLPIGKACEGARAFVINQNKLVTTTDEIGELYISAPFVALGYYNNSEATLKAFCQNPLHNNYPDIVYKTGDLVKYNDRNELEYAGRCDNQIKHSGYRIELGEIENAVNTIDGVELSACVYNKEKDIICLFFEGDKNEVSNIKDEIKNKLPSYMVPEKIEWIERFPINANGKIDRKLLKTESL